MASNELIFDVIDSARIDRLRSTLRSICSKFNASHALVCDELLKPAKPNRAAPEERENGSTNGASTKRKLDEYLGPRFAICEQCKQEFKVTENGPEECQWHEGTPSWYTILACAIEDAYG
jgi:hypothetical protein